MAALKREVSEETKLDISVGSLFGVSEWATPWRNARYIGLFFVCSLRASNPAIKLNSESSEYIWCTPDDLAELDIMKASRKIVTEYLESSTSNLITCVDS